MAEVHRFSELDPQTGSLQPVRYHVRDGSTTARVAHDGLVIQKPGTRYARSPLLPSHQGMPLDEFGHVIHDYGSDGHLLHHAASSGQVLDKMPDMPGSTAEVANQLFEDPSFHQPISQ